MNTCKKIFTALSLCVLAIVGCKQSPSIKRPDNDTAESCAELPLALDKLVQDDMFATPYIDMDEWRTEPVEHRYVHGGFEGTKMKFSFYLPQAGDYEGRFFQYITPIPINENLSQGQTGEEDKIGFSLTHGAYFIETNGGGSHLIGTADPTIAGYRANAAAATFSRIVAMKMYGCERPYGYAFGGSGGAYRTIGGLENTKGVWDGAVPFVLGSPMAIPNVFSVRMLALRELKDKLPAIADAVDVGSSVDPFSLLNEREAKILSEVTQMGFPLEAWYAHEILDMHGLKVLMPGLEAMDPGYFTDFWTKPGYAGFKPSKSLSDAKIEETVTVKDLMYAEDITTPALKALVWSEQAKGGADDAFQAISAEVDSTLPLLITLSNIPVKDLMGTNVIVKSGDAAGLKIPVKAFTSTQVVVSDDAFMHSDTRTMLKKLKVGDTINLSNLNFLAAQTYHRHQVPKEGYPVWDQFRDAEGSPIYPQRPMIVGPLFARGAAGSVPNGSINGKVIIIENLHDTEAYPWQGNWYRKQVEAQLGEQAADNFRIWMNDRMNHQDESEQAIPTQTVSYLGVVQQALLDVSAWVEKGVVPAPSTQYTVSRGQVEVPTDANARHGIQPVIKLTANGKTHARVKVDEEVKFTAEVTAPDGTGNIVSAEWSYGDNLLFEERSVFSLPNTPSRKIESIYVFEHPGTYFITLRVAAHRQGDASAEFARVYNLERVRVTVE